MMLFLFWFIRIMCVCGLILNLIVVDVHNIPSFIFMIFGLLAAANIYGLGLLAHETYRRKPSLFILFRVIQTLLLLGTKCVSWHYMVLYAGFDIFVFALFVYDSRYEFELKKIGDSQVKTIVARHDKAETTVSVISGISGTKGRHG